ncbi:hypothetical protein [Gallaecimonas xiamenensis]|uniref:hypothetical protein n=1 Tax=Gallaecimonas xiamenensis TaxID=1207039 RepID=UPI0005523A82|nr:hypothetical protein [Gallaecimonas xiamenensis]
MKGTARVSWGGLGVSVVQADVTLENGLRFFMTSTLVGVTFGGEGNIIATDLDFNPDKIEDGKHYFTTLDAVALFVGATAIVYKEDIFAKDNVGHIVFAGVGLGFSKAIGDSEAKIKSR